MDTQTKKKSKKLPIILVAVAVLLVSATVITFVKNLVPVLNVDFLAASDVAETGSLANSDTFYTPSVNNCVIDKGRTVYYYNNLLLVLTETDLSDEDAEELAKSVNGGVVGKVSGGIHSLQIKVSEADLASLEETAKNLAKDPRVLYACPEYPVQIMPYGKNLCYEDGAVPKDIIDDNLWWPNAIGADKAWEYSDLCSDINVGVVDAGIELDHEDLVGRVEMVNPQVDTKNDHGTHVTGLIVANNNDIGIRGVCDKAKVYFADVWHADSNDAFHTIGELFACYNYMAQNNVKVINNSWGCYITTKDSYMKKTYGAFYFLKNSGEYDTWIDTRINKDLVPTAEVSVAMMSQLISSGYDDLIFVQGAGNGYHGYTRNADVLTGGFFCSITESLFNKLSESTADKLKAKGITYQDIDERILVVAASDSSLVKDNTYAVTKWSNYGETVDICAPGEQIYSTVNIESGLYMQLDGTSMSAPIVTGSVAYVWSLNPELTAPEVREIILEETPNTAELTINGETYSYPVVNVGQAAKSVVDAMGEN